MKFALAIGALGLLLLSGCTQQEQNACAQIITPAVSPDGTCREYPTPCDVPDGYTVVEKCAASANLCAGIVCEDKCVGSTLYTNGLCSNGKCNYNQQFDNSACVVQEENFQFDANLVFCDYDAISKKYVLFYQIRNRTDNIPTYRSSIWLNVPALNYGNERTIQASYKKNQILWENQSYSFLGERFRWQAWEIRDQNIFLPLDFELIYCEPEFSDNGECTSQNGVLIAQGNTAQLCTKPEFT